MKPFEATLRMLVLSVLLSASSALAQAPRIFFTDLTSGPNTGGENVSGFAGAYVTLYGNNFGSSQGSSTVTLNGANCLRVVSWGVPWLWFQKTVVQLGSSCTTGNLVISTSAGASNSDVSFAVRAGRIYCVSLSGSDSNPGTFGGGCWRTLPKAVHTISAGDIAYATNGVSQTAEDNYSANLALVTPGTAAAPLALVAYPGAVVTVGNNSVEFGIRFPAVSGGPFNYWVLAGLTVRANEGISIPYATGTRAIGNDVSCPNGTGNTACVTSDGSAFTYLYGNYIHDVGNTSSTKTYHAVYWSTDANHAWMGWNTIAKVQGCRGIQFYTYTGTDMYDLHVHDNLIHDIRCDGINFSTVNPSKGAVEAYNNVIYRAGTGPDPSDGSANYACVNVNAYSAYSGAYTEVYNNTMYDCGSRLLSGNSGAVTPAYPTRLRNNIVYLTAGEVWTQSCSNISGSNNLGMTAVGCSSLTAEITADPLFQSLSNYNFHLQSASPAIGKGLNISNLRFDFDGFPRPVSGAFDIGAYQSANLSRPAPPTGLT